MVSTWPVVVAQLHSCVVYSNKPVGFYDPITPPVPNAPELWSQRIGDCIHTCIMAIGADFRMYLLRQFCSNRVKFFLQYTGDTDAKNDGPEFWNLNSVIFENFLKFSKRRRAVPLRPIWTIMVAAKLDQSRVLVTKCRQNRLTLKVEVSVRDIQTDR